MPKVIPLQPDILHKGLSVISVAPGTERISLFFKKFDFEKTNSIIQ